MESNAKNLAELLNKIQQLQLQMLQMVQSLLQNLLMTQIITGATAHDALAANGMVRFNPASWTYSHTI